jgi:hypothetical protein
MATPGRSRGGWTRAGWSSAVSPAATRQPEHARLSRACGIGCATARLRASGQCQMRSIEKGQATPEPADLRAATQTADSAISRPESAICGFGVSSRAVATCRLCGVLEDGGDGGDGVELVGGGADLRVVASSLVRGQAAGRTRTRPTQSGAESHRLEPDQGTAHFVRWMFVRRLAGHSSGRNATGSKRNRWNPRNWPTGKWCRR